MVEKGGGFAYLISSMEKYGLIQTGGGNVTITELGKILMYGEPKEIEQAKSKAVGNIELFREIAQKYGKEPQIDQIKLFLREKANVEIDKAQKLAKNIDTIYKKVSIYITSAEKLAPPTKEPIGEVPSLEPRVGRSDTLVPSDQGRTELLKIQFGDVFIQVPSDATSLESIKLAKDALEFMEQRLLKEKKDQRKE
jgi:hypothetical protein